MSFRYFDLQQVHLGHFSLHNPYLPRLLAPKEKFPTCCRTNPIIHNVGIKQFTNKRCTLRLHCSQICVHLCSCQSRFTQAPDKEDICIRTTLPSPFRAAIVCLSRGAWIQALTKSVMNGAGFFLWVEAGNYQSPQRNLLYQLHVQTITGEPGRSKSAAGHWNRQQTQFDLGRCRNASNTCT